jgi:hypothetical protein
MELIVKILDLIIYVALGFALLEVYLKVNKIWKRKAEREVAESQSILGLSLSLFILLVWTVKYIIIGEYTSIVDNAIYIFETLILLVISTGFFVGGNKKLGFMQLIKNAITLERKEATYLLNTLSGKTEAKAILEILNQLAWIDNDLDKKEEKLINDFANAWNIDFNLQKPEVNTALIFADKLNNLRSGMQSYLATEPKHEQVAQLIDLLETLVKADELVSKEEEIIFSELDAIASHYLSGENAKSYFHVLIVPQNEEHTALIRQIKPEAEEKQVAGGIAFSLEKYFSEKYAEEICEVYRNKGLFTIVQEMDC